MVHSPAVLLLAKIIILLLAKSASFLFEQFSHKQLSLGGDYCVSTTGTDESFCGCLQPPKPRWAHKNTQMMDRHPPCPTLALRHLLCLSLILEQSFSAAAKDDTSGQLFRSSCSAWGEVQHPLHSASKLWLLTSQWVDHFWESCPDWELKCSPKSGYGDYRRKNPSELTAQIFPVPGTAGKKARIWKSGSTFIPILCECKPCPRKGELSLISDVTEQTWRSFSVSLCSSGALWSSVFLS